MDAWEEVLVSLIVGLGQTTDTTLALSGIKLVNCSLLGLFSH
jgi:hypothetical protein